MPPPASHEKGLSFWMQAIPVFGKRVIRFLLSQTGLIPQRPIPTVFIVL